MQVFIQKYGPNVTYAARKYFELLFHLGKIGLLVDKSWISSRLYYFFPTSFYEWVQLILLLSEDKKITLQQIYNAVNFRLS